MSAKETAWSEGYEDASAESAAFAQIAGECIWGGVAVSPPTFGNIRRRIVRKQR